MKKLLLSLLSVALCSVQLSAQSPHPLQMPEGQKVESSYDSYQKMMSSPEMKAKSAKIEKENVSERSDLKAKSGNAALSQHSSAQSVKQHANSGERLRTFKSVKAARDRSNIGAKPLLHKSARRLAVDEPEEGTLRFVVEIPEGTECRGIALKGTYDGSTWSGADTYMGADFNAQMSPGECTRFELVEGTTNVYTADFQTLESGLSYNSYLHLACKICLIYTNDGSWQGQASDWELLTDECTAVAYVDGNLCIESRTGVISAKVNSWQMSECEETLTYNVYAMFPTCSDVTPEIVGSFNAWAGTAMTYYSDYGLWSAQISAQVGSEFKFRKTGTWEDELMYYDAEAGEWNRASNMAFGTETDVFFDFSDRSLFRWVSCPESIITEPLCYYTLVMTDMLNDGWDGNGQMMITDGDFVGYYRCEYGESPTTVQVPYYGNEVNISWVDGTCTNEISISILAPNGIGLFYHPENQTMTAGELLGTLSSSPCLTGDNPYIAQNIAGVVNEDRTMTITWDTVEGASGYRLTILKPDGKRWYSNWTTTDNVATTSVISANGDYTIIVVSYDENGIPLGSAQQVIYAEAPMLESVDISVLVPSDCEMDITDGLWIVWWTDNDYLMHVEQMTPTEAENRFNITIHPNSLSYGYYVANSSDGEQQCYGWYSLAALTHCSVVAKLDLSSYSWEMWQDSECSAVNHDYRPTNTSYELEPGAVTLHWTMPEDITYCEAVLYYIDPGNTSLSRHYYYATYQDGAFSVKCMLSNVEDLQIAYWAVYTSVSLSNNIFGHEEGFVVPGNSNLPSDPIAAANEDNTYTLSWQVNNNEYTQRLTIYADGNILVSRLEVTGDSYTTVDLSDYSYIYWELTVYSGDEYVGVLYSSFYVIPADASDLTLYFYIPQGVGFDAIDGYTLARAVQGMATQFVPLTSEGNQWYSATVTGVVESSLKFSLMNAATADEATMTTSDYTFYTYNTPYFYVERYVGDGSLQILRFDNADYYGHDIAPYNLQATPLDGRVTLTWDAAEDADGYYIELYINGEFISSGWYEGDVREAIIALSNTETAEYTWRVSAYAFGYSYLQIYGDTFTAEPSPFVATNVQATPNADGSCTITWEPAQSEEVRYYEVDVYDPYGYYVWGTTLDSPQETAVLTSVLPNSGTYRCKVYTYDANRNYLTEPTATYFDISPVEERDITVRLLLQNGNTYDSSNGVYFYTFDAWHNITAVEAADEGEGWYSATFTTSEPGLRIGVSDSYWECINISGDTCFEYTTYLHGVGCDAHLLNYTPFNLVASPEPGQVTLSWEVQDMPTRFYVTVYDAQGETIYREYFRDVTNCVLTSSNTEEVGYSWSVQPYSSNVGYGEEVFGEAFVLPPSPYVPTNITAAANGDGTYTISWDAPVSGTAEYYYVYAYTENGDNILSEYITAESIITPVLPFAGIYIVYVEAYDANWNFIGYNANTFEVEPVESHNIEVRVLVQTGFESLVVYNDAITIYTYDVYNNSTAVIAQAEGEGWYACTVTTTDPLIKIGMNGSTFTIASDTCFEYVGSLRLASCDAVLKDYTPQNLRAYPTPGFVTVAWDVIDAADAYHILLYKDSAEYYSYSHYDDGDVRQATIILSNIEQTEFRWCIQPSVSGYNMPVVWGEPFTAQPSPYMPTNLTAAANGDGTYTISWDAAPSAAVAYYEVYCYNTWNWNSAFYQTTSETRFVTPVLATGNYECFVNALSVSGTNFGTINVNFDVDTIAEHSITARVLIQPSGGYAIEDSVMFYTFDKYQNRTAVRANDEGDYWYSYTWTTTEPAIRFSISSYYGSAITIASDTCLEYFYGLNLAPCDAQVKNFTPTNLQAEVGTDMVTLSWEVQDVADSYEVYVFRDSVLWWQNSVNGTEITVVLFDTIEAEYTWAVQPVIRYSNYLDAAFGEAFTIPQSLYMPFNLNATPNGDGTFTLSWEVQQQPESYYTYVYLYDPFGNLLQSGNIYTGTSYTTPVLATEGVYTFSVDIYNRDNGLDYWSSSSFEVVQQEERDITVRVLYTPDSEFDIAAGANILLYNPADDSWTERPMTAEGDNWFSYTGSTTMPALQMRLQKRSTYSQAIFAFSTDTCYEYCFDDSFRATGCDAESHDYRIIPESMMAVSVPGRLELSWESLDMPSYYYLHIYRTDGMYIYGGYIYDRSYTYFVPDNYDSLSVVWSVTPNAYFSRYGTQGMNTVYAADSVTLHKAQIVLSELTATSTDGLQYHLSWQSNADTVRYEVQIAQNGYLVKRDVVATTSYDFLCQFNGTYTWSVRPMEAASDDYLGRSVAGESFSVSVAPEYIRNLTGEADDMKLTFSWLTDAQQVYVVLYELDSLGGSKYLMDSVLTASTLTCEVEDDAEYRLYVLPYVEYMPGMFTAVWSQRATAVVSTLADHTYLLTVLIEQGGALSGDGTGTYPAGYTVELYAYALEHYRFVGWSDGSTNQYRTLTINSDITITALFELIPQHTVTIVPCEGGIVYYNGEQVTDSLVVEVEEDAWIYVEAWANAGYNLLQWSNGSTSNYCYFKVTEDVTIAPMFVQNCNVVLTAGEGGSITSVSGYYTTAGDTLVCRYGATLNISVTPDAGYKFVGWSDGDMSVVRLITITGDMQLEAMFEPVTEPLNRYYVGIATEGHGYVNISTGWYDEGSQITLTATPYYGSHFVCWSDSITDNPRVIVVTQDISLTAIFDYTTYSLTVLATEGGTVNDSTVNGEYYNTYVYGITATADEHYHFVGWSDGNSYYERSVYVNRDTTITAIFALDQYSVTFLDADSSFIETHLFDWGEVPDCTIVPSKEPDDEYEYTFIGWTPELEAVTADAVYVAVYEATPIISAVENVSDDSRLRPVKCIEDGQLIIIMPDGTRYNVAGIRIR